MSKEKEFKVTVEELDNGNGWTYAIDGNREAPNWDIGETWENMIGYKSKKDAFDSGTGMTKTMKEWAKGFEAMGDWPSDPHGYEN